MLLDAAACWARLLQARHAVLSTRHAKRGVDAVPVVFAVVRDDLVVPVDTVKPKRHARLQRVRNLEADPRCVLLVDHYDDDWSRLWWVRVHALGEAVPAQVPEEVIEALGDRYRQLRAPGAVVAALRLRVTSISGWRMA